MSNREQSEWIRLRNFHNAVKYELLKSVVNYYDDKGIENLSLLDVSVGKGGDYPKWKKLGIKKVMGMDPSKASIDIAKKRFPIVKDKFIHTPPDSKDGPGTAITTDWSNGGPPLKQKLYDIVSCQMSLHYFFKKESMLRNAIKNISDSLLPGGIFIGTSMNEKEIIRKLIKSKTKFRPDLIFFNFIKDRQELTPSYVLKWGDSDQIENYMKKIDERDPNLELDNEFLVSKKIFLDICKHFNLYPVRINDFVNEFVSFKDWYDKIKNEEIELWSRSKDMKMKDYEQFMSFMYESFVFIKRIDLMKEE